jgi:hypothetical protein
MTAIEYISVALAALATLARVAMFIPRPGKTARLRTTA